MNPKVSPEFSFSVVALFVVGVFSFGLSSGNFDGFQNIVKNKSEADARIWLDNNITGLGYKEASHFLRNTGHFNLAILDRHIINLMFEHNIINSIPKPIKKSDYLLIEKEFIKLAKNLDVSPAELDLNMWYLKVGEVLK